MEWTRINRYAWRSEDGYTITANRVPTRDDTPDNAHPAPYGTDYDNLVRLVWYYVLYAPVKHPHTGGAEEGLIGASYDPGELREKAVSHQRARAIGGQQ